MLARTMVASQATLLRAPQMPFMTLSKGRVSTKTVQLMGSQPTRAFAGGLPDHIVMEMPNLSPTMEKVSTH